MKKQFLIVAATENKLKQVYQFIAESVSPIATRYSDNKIETPNYDVQFMLENKNTLGMKIDQYVYLGEDNLYEMLYLKPLLIK